MKMLVTENHVTKAFIDGHVVCADCGKPPGDAWGDSLGEHGARVICGACFRSTRSPA